MISLLNLRIHEYHDTHLHVLDYLNFPLKDCKFKKGLILYSCLFYVVMSSHA